MIDSSGRVARDLNSLGEDGRWLDLGAGQARAAGEYLNAGGKASVTVLTVEDQTDEKISKLQNDHSSFKYLTGKYFEDYKDGELGGKYDVVTDIYGAVSYSKDLDMVMKKAFDQMKVGGRMYTIIASTKIKNSRGEAVSLASWFKDMKCVRQERVKGSDEDSIMLVKTCEDVTVPNLELQTIKSGQPPARDYLYANGKSDEGSAPAIAAPAAVGTSVGR